MYATANVCKFKAYNTCSPCRIKHIGKKQNYAPFTYMNG